MEIINTKFDLELCVFYLFIMFRIIFSNFLRRHNSTIRCYDVVLLFFLVSLGSLCFATDEDGCAVENFAILSLNVHINSKR